MSAPIPYCVRIIICAVVVHLCAAPLLAQELPRYDVRRTCLAAKICTEDGASCRINTGMQYYGNAAGHSSIFTTPYITKNKTYIEVCISGSGKDGDQDWSQNNLCFPIQSPPDRRASLDASSERASWDRAGAANETKENIRAATVSMCKDSFRGYSELTSTARASIDSICAEEGNKTVQALTTPLYTFYGLYDTNKGVDNSDLSRSIKQPIPLGTQIRGLQWEDWQYVHVNHKWNLVEFIEPQAPISTPTPILSEEAAGFPTGAGLQHGEQTFVTGTPDPNAGAPPAGTCSSFTYDPYGRVFDAGTLEPVSGARVILYQLIDGKYQIPSLPYVPESGYVTGDDGVFSFIVPDGDYKLEVLASDDPIEPILQNRLKGSVFEVESRLIKSYSTSTGVVRTPGTNGKVLYSELYPLNVQYPRIIQAGKIEHRDLPVKTGVFTSTVKLTGVFQNRRTNGDIELLGTLTHPFATVVVNARNLQDDQMRPISKIEADKDGKFTVVLRPALFKSTEVFGSFTVYKPTDVTKENPVSLTTEVMPFYLEGIAREGGDEGQILGETVVGLYRQGSFLPDVTVRTDKNGYFRIPARQMPIDNFVIKYGDSPENDSAISPSEFVSSNLDYYLRPEADKELQEVQIVESEAESKTHDRPVPIAEEKTPSQTTQNRAPGVMALIGYLVLLAILGFSASLLIVAMKRHSQTKFDQYVSEASDSDSPQSPPTPVA